MAIRKIRRHLKREEREVTKWIADFRLPDGSRPLPEFNSKREAEEELARQKLLRSKKKEDHRKLVEQTAGRPAREIRELVNFHIRTGCAHWTQEARKDLESRLRPFANWCDDQGIAYAHQVLKPTAAAYREYLLNEAVGVRGKRISPKTAEHWLIAASNIFESELDLQEPSAITQNPFRKIRKTGYARKRLPVLIEQQQLRAFFGQCSEFEYHLFRLEYAGGFRAGEVRNLTWAQVRGKHIDLSDRADWRAKTEESAKLIEVNAYITESLAWFRLQSGKKKYVLDPETFVRAGGHKGPRLDRVGKNFIADRFAMVRQRAEAAHPNYDWSRLTPHKLRTAFGSHLAELGVPLPTVQRLMRHKNYKTTAEMYVRVSDDAISRGARTLEQVDLTPLSKAV